MCHLSSQGTIESTNQGSFQLRTVTAELSIHLHDDLPALERAWGQLYPKFLYTCGAESCDLGQVLKYSGGQCSPSWGASAHTVSLVCVKIKWLEGWERLVLFPNAGAVSYAGELVQEVIHISLRPGQQDSKPIPNFQSTVMLPRNCTFPKELDEI